MSMLSVARQARPEITLAVCRGACRLMRQAGHSVLLEVPLPDGRRADIFAVGRSGDITIVEVKSSIEDWRVDAKWPDYLGWCDQLYFAVPIDFPQALIPEDIGLIVADAYGGDLLRHPPRRPMAAAEDEMSHAARAACAPSHPCSHSALSSGARRGDPVMCAW
jgi:hypothetical protein